MRNFCYCEFKLIFLASYGVERDGGAPMIPDTKHISDPHSSTRKIERLSKVLLRKML